MTASEELEMNTLQDAETHHNSVLDDPSSTSPSFSSPFWPLFSLPYRCSVKDCTFLIAEKIDHGKLRLIGDINLFLQEDYDASCLQGEVNIMIGESDARRKGLAKEALILGCLYVIEHHDVGSLVARISDSNAPSINLFQNKLNWPLESHSEVFSETTFKVSTTPDFFAELQCEVPDYRVSHDYDAMEFVYL